MISMLAALRVLRIKEGFRTRKRAQALYPTQLAPSAARR